jgi:hypothetical protein
MRAPSHPLDAAARSAGGDVSDKTFMPTMALRVMRVANYSYAETHGVVYDDTLQQLWVATNPDGYDDAEWRDVPIWEKR